MSTFVLVHGAWQSTGTWDRLAPLLEEHGHRVITPVLSGLGTDQSRLSPDVTLQQHVEDVSAEVSKSPERVILVGHSYAGMIISGVVETNPAPVQRLVFLDAFIPETDRAHWICFRLRLVPIFARLRRNMETVGGYRAAKDSSISGD